MARAIRFFFGSAFGLRVFGFGRIFLDLKITFCKKNTGGEQQHWVYRGQGRYISNKQNRYWNSKSQQKALASGGRSLLGGPIQISFKTVGSATPAKGLTWFDFSWLSGKILFLAFLGWL